MESCNFKMNRGEKAEFLLRNLYEACGFSRFKMNKFEEYDLYVRNKDFLISDSIITFTDTNGKLLAMKPDVTLSIIKNFREEGKTLNKVFYDENVYRIASNGSGFKEIKQIGIESMGQLAGYDIYEVLLLAAKSLKILSNRAVLNISHFGILSDVMDSLTNSKACKAKLYEAVGKKNLHEIRRIGEEAHISAEKTEKLCILVSTYGSPSTVIKKLRTEFSDSTVLSKIDFLEEVCSLLSNEGCEDMIVLDFSVVNHTDYYNGIVFKGFVEKIPTGILSGGQYDGLMKKMGCNAGAIGFAVYLDALEDMLFDQREVDVEALLLYRETDSIPAVEKAVSLLKKDFESVSVQKEIPKKMRYRKLFEVCDGGVKCNE